DGLARALGIGAPVHFAAGSRDLLLESLEVEVEVLQHVVLDVARGVAQRLELRQPGGGRGPALDEVLLHMRERPLQLRVGKGAVGVVLEPRGGDGLHYAPSPCPSPAARERGLPSPAAATASPRPRSGRGTG